jgi:FHS family glucose/mannose:H+ symporter-like MFS transporter
MIGRSWTSFLLHASFVLTGVVTTLLGPILPILVARWALSDWQAGLLFTMQFAGSMVGVALSSVGMTRLGFRATLVIGAAFMAAGVAALAGGPQALGYSAVLCYGIGLGLTIPATNLAVAEQYAERRAAALNLLNLAWGVGAVSAPPVIALLQRTNDTRVFLLGLAATLTLMAGALARSSQVPRQEPTDSLHGSASWWNRGVLVFGALLFVYVGTETAVAGWVGVYAQRLDLASDTGAVAAPSVFWALLLLGRALAPLVLLQMAEERLVGLSLVLATAGVGAMLIARSTGPFFFAVMLGGLGLSTVFPITVSLFTRTFERDAARLAGPIFALAGLGGATLPSLVGLISAQVGSLKAGLFVPLLGCVLMIALHARRARLGSA